MGSGPKANMWPSGVPSTCSQLQFGSTPANDDRPISLWARAWTANPCQINRLGATATAELDRIINPEKVRGSMKHASAGGGDTRRRFRRRRNPGCGIQDRPARVSLPSRKRSPDTAGPFASLNFLQPGGHNMTNWRQVELSEEFVGAKCPPSLIGTQLRNRG